MTNNAEVLVIDNVYKRYEDVEVLKGISLKIGRGESIAIIGASGSGKTTLLLIACGLEYPTSGKVFFNNIDIHNLSEDEKAEWRLHNVGIIFQYSYLLPEFTVLENVLLPTYPFQENNKKEFEDYALKILDYLGLSSKIHARITTLSGGEQQRVAIARAMINSPKIIFADEPTGNLNPENSLIVGSLLFNLIKKENKSLLLVTHNYEIAQKADKIFKIENGKLFEISKEHLKN